MSLHVAYKTKLGTMFSGSSEEFFSSPYGKVYKNKIQLIFTSPPFPLNRKKRYGNLQGEAYIDWLKSFTEPFKSSLKRDGSIVMEMGNAWEKGKPVMSTLALKSLLSFLDTGDLNLCQQFICHNPARLPSPAQWVNVERSRVKDSFTQVWWMSPTTTPKADNRRVLKNYSESMLKLLKSRKYNAGKRPSEHNIGGSSFLKNNNGAIPSNVLVFSNTGANDNYQLYCRKNNLEFHPARMPINLAEFFIKFLTDQDDIVFDPFAGSNTTGAAAERLGRRWISIEPNEQYVKGSLGRFKAI